MIEDILQIGNFIISILPSERKSIQKITEELAKTTRNDSEVEQLYIMVKIRQVYDFDEEKIKKNDIYRKTICSLILCYRERPPQLMSNEMVQKILNKLYLLLAQIVPANETNNDKPSVSAAPVIKKKSPTIHDYLVEFCNQLVDDRPYEVKVIKKEFADFLQKSGKAAKESGLNADISYAIVNDPNRYHYNAPDPKKDRLFVNDPSIKSNLLLYFPDENNRKIVKKFSLKIKDNPTIYWRENNERKEIKLSDLR
ncbi:MAG: hypothetical protein LBB64_02585 [Dysgonamonadaceae bacterium]|jgi:hypothetical protein|nr:hypothetical protein [Dysgonamonadaceae bacterium]